MLSFDIQADADDGTEANQAVWHQDGYAESGLNRMGAAGGEHYHVELRFHLADVRQGETFAYAPLVVSATGYGQVDTIATLCIVGVDQDSAVGLEFIGLREDYYA